MTIEELYTQRCNTEYNINQHMPMLRSLAEECDHVTEFGTYEGYSTTAFLAASPKVLHSYDLSFGQMGLREVLTASEVKATWVMHRASTLEVEIEPTDLLFIDSEHTYEQVRGELELHGDRARRYILLHDIALFPGIVTAIFEWLARHAEWRLREWSTISCGMAVLERIK